MQPLGLRVALPDLLPEAEALWDVLLLLQTVRVGETLMEREPLADLEGEGEALAHLDMLGDPLALGEVLGVGEVELQ